MPEQVSVTNSFFRNWEIATSDTVVTDAEATTMVLGLVRDGRITDGELQTAQRVVKLAQTQARDVLSSLSRDTYNRILNGGDAVVVARENTQRGTQAKANEAIAVSIQKALNDGRSAIRKTVPGAVDEVSYSGFDWKIFDSEANAALNALAGTGTHFNEVVTAFSDRENGKYLRRLIDNLPSSDRARFADLLADNAFGPVIENIQSRAGSEWRSLLSSSSRLQARIEEE